MSGTALAQSVAQWLTMEGNMQQEALSALSQYKTKVLTKGGVTSGHNKIQKCDDQISNVPQDEVYGEYQLFGSPGILGGGPRRGSYASTSAGRSTADSAEFADSAWSEAPSDMAFSPMAAAAYYNYPPGFVEALSRPQDPNARSTLKIANIPRRCGKEELLAAIEAVGYGSAYDFFYLPLGPQSKKNHGYAFINFKSNDLADGFAAVFSGYPIRAKLLDVGLAPLQGLQQNIDHFSKTSAAKSGWTPNIVLKI